MTSTMMEPAQLALLSALGGADFRRLAEAFGSMNPQILASQPFSALMQTVCQKLTDRPDCWHKVARLLQEWARQKLSAQAIAAAS